MIEATAVKHTVATQPVLMAICTQPDDNWDEVCKWANQCLQQWENAGQEMAKLCGGKWEVDGASAEDFKDGGTLRPFSLDKNGEPYEWVRLANGGEELLMVAVRIL